MARDLLERSKRRRRKLLTLLVVRWVLGALLLFLSAVGIFYLPSFRVHSITIRGASEEEAIELKKEISSLLSEEYLFIFPKDTMLFLPREEITNLLRTHPLVKEFRFERRFPSEIDISIVEQEVWAIGCNNKGEVLGNCAFLNHEGFAFAPASLFSGTAVLKMLDARERTILGANILPREALSGITFLIEKLDKRLGGEVQSVEIISDDTFHLILREGWFLILDSQTDVSRGLENLVLALESQIKEARENLEYVDLRFPDRIFYRLLEP